MLGLNLNPPASVSHRAGIISVDHHTQLKTISFNTTYLCHCVRKAFVEILKYLRHRCFMFAIKRYLYKQTVYQIWPTDQFWNCDLGDKILCLPLLILHTKRYLTTESLSNPMKFGIHIIDTDSWLVQENKLLSCPPAHSFLFRGIIHIKYFTFLLDYTNYYLINSISSNFLT